ncbi:MAG: phage/plasmid primase, P4 family [Salinivirgaceae bacterium]|nr:phage/plasmid primase, P4 family [Salinivirgaceae bacterium]
MTDITSDITDIRAQVEARRKEEEEALPPEEPKVSGEQPPPDGKFVRDCLSNNERGDGVLLATLMRDRIVYVKRTQRWMIWNGVHWEDDKRDLSHSYVEQVASLYLREADRLTILIDEARERKKSQEAKADACKTAEDNEGEAAARLAATAAAFEIRRHTEERKAFTRRVDRLRSVRGAKNCMEWAHKIGNDSLAIVGDEIDQQPWLLPCSNGVVDLRTGRLMPGQPQDYLVTAVPVEFPDCQDYLQTGQGFGFPPWSKFIEEIHLGDEDVIEFVHRLFGYSITGLTTEHFIGTFVGDGRNGKGTMMETIRSALGELAWAIQPEMILEQKNPRSSAGPSADMMSLYGRRFVIASETDEGQRISAGRVKRLTGADTITARSPHDKFDINFRPTHTLFLYTNDIPQGLTKDFALLQRLLFIRYPLRYVDDPETKAREDPHNAEIYRLKDPSLPVRLLEGLPWVLAWLVRGCLLWQRDGLAPPRRIKADIEQLRLSEDVLGQFLESSCDCTDPENWMYFRELYINFRAWYRANIDDRKDDKYLPSKKKVALWLDKKGFSKNNTGDRIYYGIRVTDPSLFTVA